jgi:hypothetical protein
MSPQVKRIFDMSVTVECGGDLIRATEVPGRRDLRSCRW